MLFMSQQLLIAGRTTAGCFKMIHDPAACHLTMFIFPHSKILLKDANIASPAKRNIAISDSAEHL